MHMDTDDVAGQHRLRDEAASVALRAASVLMCSVTFFHGRYGQPAFGPAPLPHRAFSSSMTPKAARCAVYTAVVLYSAMP